MQKDRPWTALVGKFQKIPFTKEEVQLVEDLLAQNRNVLIQLKKKVRDDKYTEQERFTEICKLFPEETKRASRIIVAHVPDIVEVVTYDNQDWFIKDMRSKKDE